MNAERDEVVVVGGGPAGAATALQLARAGVRVRLITGWPERRSPDGQVLAAVGRHALTELGVWADFAALRFRPSYATLSCWATADVVDLPCVLNPYGPGWNVMRPEFDQMLRSRAEQAGAVICTGAHVAAQPDGDRWRLTVRRDDHQPENLCAPILIDATGRRGVLARRWGRSDRRDRMIGIRHRLAGPPEDVRSVLTVESTPHGWWYTVPVRSGGLAVYEMTDRDLWRRDRSGPRFAATTLTRQRCSGQALAGLGGVHPAGTLRRRIDVASLLAVGDAAIARDPLSAEGLVFALVSAREAAGAAAAMLAGDRHLRQAYEEGLDRVYEQYLTQRREAYAVESRWTDQPFWRRRRR